MKNILLFPTPVWYEDIDIETISLVEYSYGCRYADPMGREKSNHGGWHSRYFSGHIIKELRELETIIIERAKSCAIEFGYGDLDLAISDIWININETGHFNTLHIHPSSFLSGVFYVMARPGQGDLVVHRCNMQNFIINSVSNIQDINTLNASSGSFEPKTGRLILFPSSLPHEVYANNLEEDRISISFNIVKVTA